MSYVDNEHEKSYVVTYKELLFIFIVFTTILIVLYPKDLLKKEIASEESSYELSMLYLENLLKHSPDDESLMLILAEQSLRASDKERSLSLLDTLVHSSDETIKKKATLLNYELEKDSYFYLHTQQEKRKKRTRLKQLFYNIYKHHMYDENEISKWYSESLFVSNNKATYDFVQQLIKKDSSKITYLEQAFYLSQKYNKKKDSRKYVRLLQKYDLPNQEKWIYVEYYMYINYHQYSKAEKLLKLYAQGSAIWTSRLGDFYIMRNSYKKASDTYIKTFNNSTDYKEKRKYFKKAVKAYQAGSKMDEAANLARKYENIFLHDRNVRNFILKVYVATGKLKYASALSKRILRKELR